MNAEQNYQQHAILFIDDEEQSQKYFSQIFSKTFRVYLASNGAEGLDLFRENIHEIGVVVSDQRMPGMAGSELLAKIAKESPDVVKILSTAYSDLDAAIDAVNEGGIYRYVTKPWDLAELEVTLRRAMDYYHLKEQHRMLARVKIAGLEQMFHQSRLLACLAIPSLLNSQPAAVAAFRDLMRLSLEDSDMEPQSKFANLRALSQEGRQELMELFKLGLQKLIAFVEEQEGPSPDDLKLLEKLLTQTDPGKGRYVLVNAFFMFLQGEADDSEILQLAILIAAYQANYEIRRDGQHWKMSQITSGETSPTAFEELFSLFVDDAFLVGSILGELG